MKKKIIVGIAALLCGGILLQQGYIGAQNSAEKEPEAVSSRLPENHVFKRIDENGKIIIEDTAKLEAETKKEQAARENMAKVKGIAVPEILNMVSSISRRSQIPEKTPAIPR